MRPLPDWLRRPTSVAGLVTVVYIVLVLSCMRLQYISNDDVTIMDYARQGFPVRAPPLVERGVEVAEVEHPDATRKHLGVVGPRRQRDQQGGDQRGARIHRVDPNAKGWNGEAVAGSVPIASQSVPAAGA